MPLRVAEVLGVGFAFLLAGAWVWLGSETAWASELNSAVAPKNSSLSSEASASLRPILESIGSLEQEQDAKCNSTASRFEDFVFGTPLTDGARLRKVELQKEWIEAVWSGASALEKSAGKDSVSAEALKRQMAEFFRVESANDSDVSLRFLAGKELQIPARRVEQYGSIAFSLRAILAVQQEQLFFGSDPPPLPLTQESLDALRAAVDLLTISALMGADARARTQSDFEIGTLEMEESWRELVAAPETEGPGPGLRPLPERVGQEHALLDELIDRKVEAYRAYNELTDRKAQALFITNTVRFYARAKIEGTAEARAAIIQAVDKEVDLFSRQLFDRAQKIARRNGHVLIRSDDALAATRELLPHSIDEFEDVRVFPKLPAAEQVLLESYDCDSFRDFGVHWVSLKAATLAQPDDALSLDPFAAEVIAETISQYGVLLLRVAGMVRRESGGDVFLLPVDLRRSASVIAERTKRHKRAAPVSVGTPKIVSAPADPLPDEAESLFFSDRTVDSGLNFVHRSSRWLGEFRHKQVNTPPTFSGGGVAAEDIDGDGLMDVLLLGGAGNSLFVGRGDGRFEDVTEQAGLRFQREDGSPGEARKPIIADLDNDGLQDILITYANDDHRLYRNLGQRQFQDVTSGSGLGGKGLVGGPATAFDYDGDGLLDLYIGYFGDYLAGDIPTQERDNHAALPNRLFRNQGGMQFADVTETSGTGDRGWTQAVTHFDFDQDGLQDIMVANDYGLNALFRNRGDGTFEDVAFQNGMTKALHSMNVGVTDINADGYPDIYISNIATLVKDNKYAFPDVDTPLDFNPRAMSGMLVKESDSFFVSRTEDSKLGGYDLSRDVERGATSTGWAWDAEFLDFDLDGDDDLYLVNGTNDYNAFATVYRYGASDGSSENAHSRKKSAILLSHSRESNVFFVNEGGKLKNRSSRSGSDFVGNSRSTAYLDIDEDGDLDVVVNNFHGPATLLQNNSERRGRNWLKLKLIGAPSRGSNRDAIGSKIIVKAGDRPEVTRFVQGGSGYLSMNPKQQHFGLADETHAEAEVTWPNGEVQRFSGLEVNQTHVLAQKSAVTPPESPSPSLSRDSELPDDND